MLHSFCKVTVNYTPYSSAYYYLRIQVTIYFSELFHTEERLFSADQVPAAKARIRGQRASLPRPDRPPRAVSQHADIFPNLLKTF